MAHEPRYANGAARRALRSRLRAEGRPCWICVAAGRAGTIDYSLPFPHPHSFVADELVPVSRHELGGYPTPQAAALDYANLAAAHKCCNEWRSNMTVDETLEAIRKARGRCDGRDGRKGGPPAAGPVRTSRDWRNPDGGGAR